MNKLTLTSEGLLWAELFALWAAAAYGVTSDPLPEDRTNKNSPSAQWKRILAARTVGATLTTLAMSGSIILSIWMFLIISAQPWLRFKRPSRQTAEVETSIVILNLLITFILITHFHLTLHRGIPTSLTAEQLAAVSITVGTLLFVVRGGTYIVRGCLRKAGTLPVSVQPVEPDEVEIDITIGQSSPSQHIPREAGEGSQPLSAENISCIDIQEINRGRLIGNFERLLLTLVVAAGSYAALAFLVAAKGLIRHNDLEDREFAEYFLVGSLSSVLVALCAGIALRFALLALWPALLSLQMQGS